MGLLGKLFGGEKDHPALDPASPAASRIERNRAVLEEFARKLHDKVELVPGERAVYAFIGRPPEAFGIAWFEHGEEHNFKRLMSEKGLQQRDVQVRSDQLRSAYVRARDEPRYAMTLGGKKVLVTPSATLERDLAQIIHDVEG